MSDERKPRGNSELSLDVDVENELIVLGALANDPETWRRELPRLRPEEFVSPRNRKAVEVFRRIRADGGAYARDTAAQLSDGELPLKWLADLERNFAALPERNFALHLGLVRRAARKAGTADDFAELYANLEDPHADLAETEASALGVLRKLREGRRDARLRRGESLRREWFAGLEDVARNRAENFRETGFTPLDRHLYRGLRPGDVVVLAGRPGMGKSTLCSVLTRRQSRRKRRVLSAPIEAGTDSVVEQMVCANLELEAERLIKTPDQLTEEELFKIEKAAKLILDDECISFDDELDSLDDLEARVEEESYDLVILDIYEYLLKGELKPSLVTDSLRRLKKLAKRRKFCAVVVHQIRRLDKRIGKKSTNLRPQLHELKNSGGYEEVADLVLLIHREKYYDPEAAEDDILEVEIAKQRRGPQKVVVGFEFYPEVCRIGKESTTFEKRTD